MNENGVKMGEGQSWEAVYKYPAFKPEKTNETPQVSSHSRESKESQASDCKPYAIDETIEMLPAEHCMPKKKAGKKEVKNVSSTRRTDDVSNKSFLKHIRHSRDCKEKCCSIVQKC